MLSEIKPALEWLGDIVYKWRISTVCRSHFPLILKKDIFLLDNGSIWNYYFLWLFYFWFFVRIEPLGESYENKRNGTQWSIGPKASSGIVKPGNLTGDIVASVRTPAKIKDFAEIVNDIHLEL